MRNIFFISDTHFFHSNMLKFTGDDGKRIREFSCVEEMNEKIVENWNSVVRDQDKVYHLGDVSFRYDRPASELLHRLRGHKRLILGNHDRLERGQLLLPRCFDKILLWRIFKEHDFVATHIPLREDQLRKVSKNVHGHIHQRVMKEEIYRNVCVEHTNYFPLEISEL